MGGDQGGGGGCGSANDFLYCVPIPQRREWCTCRITNTRRRKEMEEMEQQKAQWLSDQEEDRKKEKENMPMMMDRILWNFEIMSKDRNRMEAESIEKAHDSGHWFVTGISNLEGLKGEKIFFELEYAEGYFEGIIGVTPGESLSINVGTGGTAATVNNGSGGNGGSSSVSFYATAFGGSGSSGANPGGGSGGYLPYFSSDVIMVDSLIEGLKI